MDDAQNRLARELAVAIAAAVQHSADVEACRGRAREAGYHLKVTLDATVGFAALPGHEPDAVAPGDGDEGGAVEEAASLEMSANDRRFLRSLRIAVDDVRIEEAN